MTGTHLICVEESDCAVLWRAILSRRSARHGRARSPWHPAGRHRGGHL